MKKKIFLLSLVLITILQYVNGYSYKRYLANINKSLYDNFSLVEGGKLIINSLGNGTYKIEAINHDGWIFLSAEVSYKGSSSEYYYYKGTGIVGDSSKDIVYTVTIETEKLKMSDFVKGAGNKFDFRVEDVINALRIQLDNGVETSTMNIVPIIND